MTGKLNIKNIKLVRWFVPLELNHTSYIYTSLVEFTGNNNIKFEISSKNLNKKGKLTIVDNQVILHNNSTYSKVTFIEIEFKDNSKRRYAFDLSDSPNDFPYFALENSDLVFKRTFLQETVIKLNKKHQEKILPLGIPFMVKPNRFLYKAKIKFLYLFFKFQNGLKLDRYLIKRIWIENKKSLNHWNQFNKTRSLSDFDNKLLENVNNKIFYQKRLFPNEEDIDTQNIHQQRISIIRLLKKHFPKHFIGGLKCDPPFTDKYPDCISNIDGDPKVFLKAFKECGICIYTRGLTHSTGWTLPEFLSQGKFIIAEKSKIQFPVSLVDKEHLVYFSTFDELIYLCEKYLKDENERNRISTNGFNYYQKFVNPSVFITQLLFKTK